MKELLDQVFTVERIMTPQADLSAWPADGDAQALWGNKDLARFDLVPATEKGQIAGLWIRNEDKPVSLKRNRLISRDTPIAHLLELFVETGSKGFLVIYGQEIQGIVTPADLNKLPMRAYLYNLIGDLEMTLGAWIGELFRVDASQFLEILPANRQKRLKRELKRMKAGNTDVNVVELFYLTDLNNIVTEHEQARSSLGYPSADKARLELSELNELRKGIMHPVKSLLGKIPEDLEKLHGRVQRAREVLERLDILASKTQDERAIEEATMATVTEFVKDDPGYLRWLDTHPRGYVVNTERTRNRNYMVLHRSTCWTIGRDNPNVGADAFTGGQYIKICAPDVVSLRAWVRKHGRPDGSFSKECGLCHPAR